ncbi:hypothetical protein [Micromonospora sp. WMMD1082]|uniref:hypothetical protein n=1 Tax=Micromonospora sp. WMMD1082 TaxID=3016104 RepID=UPI002415DD75|nr:hypothetical protein [Micromonospora sp. WMMD1082]MDG4792677.1 hypothetical protein [Micromonospora sp. WMMD1082]
MRTAALALTLALTPSPAPSDDPGLLGRVVEGVTTTVDDLLGTGPSATPTRSPEPAPTTPPSPARTPPTEPAPSTPGPAQLPELAPAPRSDAVREPAPTASPSSSGAVPPEAARGVAWAPVPADDDDDRVYVVGFAALALPVGWLAWRSRRPKPTPAPAPLSAAQWEAAYELGRADARTRPAEAARVIPFRRPDSEKPPAS